MTDDPVGVSKSGRPVYDNAATVVCLLIPEGLSVRRLLVIKRNNNPGKGLFGLPGGYQMYGETWQQAGCREVLEETGYVVKPKNTKLISLITDEYNNNLIIAKTSSPWLRRSNFKPPEEVQEVFWADIDIVKKKENWAFPLHYEAAEEFFFGKPNNRMDANIEFKSGRTYGYETL